MPYTRLYVIFFIFLFVSPASFAWNTYGHLLVAELALKEISPQKARELDSLAYSLVREMDSQKRLYLMRTYDGTSSVAHLSTFPDEWREQTLGELFDQYGTAMPQSLEGFGARDTSQWHYVNQAYTQDPQAANCSNAKGVQNTEVNLAVVLPKLIDAYQEADDTQDKALVFAFILHLVGDAHNPLHAVTKIDKDCVSDRGGNGFCATFRSASRSCKENLHQAWDRALGFFDEHTLVADAADFVSRVDVDEAAAENLDPNVWVAEGYDLARLVYSAQANKDLDSYYVSEAQIISYERIALAAKRLAKIFEQL